MRAARFEIVRTDAGWHGRFIAANGKTVWTTEVYTRRRAAEGAIGLLDSTLWWIGPTREIDERTR